VIAGEFLVGKGLYSRSYTRVESGCGSSVPNGPANGDIARHGYQTKIRPLPRSGEGSELEQFGSDRRDSGCGRRVVEMTLMTETDIVSDICCDT
jgi:hypothetical protein